MLGREGTKIDNMPAEKEERSGSKSPSREINAENDLKTTISLSKPESYNKSALPKVSSIIGFTPILNH